MVPVEGVGDVGAANAVNLDFEPVTNLPGVIERIEVVQVANDGGGIRTTNTECQNAKRKEDRESFHDGCSEGLACHAAPLAAAQRCRMTTGEAMGRR
jgi:hypothetical protein